MTRVITVDPGRPAAGEYFPEATTAWRRYRFLQSRPAASRTTRNLINFISGISGPHTGMTATRDSFALAGRLTLGGFLIVCSFLSGVNGVSILLASLGVALVVGLLTRISAFAFGVMEIAQCWIVYKTGDISVGYGLLAIASLVVAWMGPGHISADAIIRHRLFRSIKRRRDRKLMEKRLSYEAWKYSF